MYRLACSVLANFAPNAARLWKPLWKLDRALHAWRGRPSCSLTNFFQSPIDGWPTVDQWFCIDHEERRSNLRHSNHHVSQSNTHMQQNISYNIFLITFFVWKSLIITHAQVMPTKWALCWHTALVYYDKVTHTNNNHLCAYQVVVSWTYFNRIRANKNNDGWKQDESELISLLLSHHHLSRMIASQSG